MPFMDGHYLIFMTQLSKKVQTPPDGDQATHLNINTERKKIEILEGFYYRI
jgi:hypothetical protein